MEQLRKKNARGVNLNRVLGVENTLFDLEKREQLGKDKKRDHKIKKLLKLEKEIDETIESTRNLIRLKKENETTKDRIITDIRYIYWSGKRRLL